MNKENELYAYFTITGSFDPSAITSQVGIKPTDAWQEGELNPKSQEKYKFSRWTLRSRLDRTAELEKHVRDVLSQLKQNEEGFRSISKEFGGCMQLVGYFNANYPGLHFEEDIVEDLAKYKLSVDFDFYHLYLEKK